MDYYCHACETQHRYACPVLVKIDREQAKKK